MLSAITNKLLCLVLIPVMLAAQILCVCSSHAAAAPKAQDHSPAAHECCDGDDDDHASDTPGKPAKHDPSCNHCTHNNEAQPAPERSELSKSTTFLLPVFAPLLPDFFADSLGLENAQARAFTEWLSDPYPPPNLLRVKCTLQI